MVQLPPDDDKLPVGVSIGDLAEEGLDLTIDSTAKLSGISQI